MATPRTRRLQAERLSRKFGSAARPESIPKPKPKVKAKPKPKKSFRQQVAEALGTEPLPRKTQAGGPGPGGFSESARLAAELRKKKIQKKKAQKRKSR